MTKLALLTFYSPSYQPVADITVPDKDEYCRRHGYQHIVKVGPYKDRPWYYGFDNKAFIYDLFFDPVAAGQTESPDIVWCLNVPSAITNLTKPVTDFLDDDHDFWVSKDVHDINMGSHLFRKSEWTRRWLQFIIDSEPQYRSDGWQEQRCVIEHWQDPEWLPRIKLLEQNDINSYLYTSYGHSPWYAGMPGDWKPGDLVLSLPGKDLGKRLAILTAKEMKDRIIR